MALIKLADANVNPEAYNLQSAIQKMPLPSQPSMAGSTTSRTSIAGTSAPAPTYSKPYSTLNGVTYNQGGAPMSSSGSFIPVANASSGSPTYNAGLYTFNGPQGTNSAGQTYAQMFNTQPNSNYVDTTRTQPVTLTNTPTPAGSGVGNGQTDRFAVLDALRNNAASYYQPTQDETDTMQALGNIISSRDLGINKIMSTPDTMDVLTGTSDYLSKQAEAQTQPLQAKLGILQARRQAAIQGYQAALGAEQTKQGLQQPVQVGMGSALVNPTTGQQMGGNASFDQLNGGQGSGGLIGSLAQQILNGTSFDDAAGQLPSPYMRNALLQAVMSQNPNFNITQSNQNATARNSALEQNATTVRPMVNSQQTAIQHLDNLDAILQKVNFGNFPLVNGVRQWFSGNGIANPDIQQLNSEINIIRGEVAKVLGGGTVSVESQNEAKQVVPDNISPENYKQVSDNIKALMQSKIEQSTNLNNVQQYGAQQPTQSGGGSSWDF